MGLFDIFKKKKEEPKPLLNPDDMTLWDLQAGDILDYDFKTWEIKAAFEYDWGNNFFSKEFKLDAGDDLFFLHLEDSHGDLDLSISRKIDVKDVGKEVRTTILDTDEAPKTLIYKGKTYTSGKMNLGHFRDMSNNEWTEFVSWHYLDEAEQEFVTIERWSEHEIEASAGMYVEEREFSNFLIR
ncbi:MAG: DUF4178 domain-containing protein [Bacteroidetes bacterium]|nr:MAG: DUF4178 domain-containing protein [Bacteroidota bacterium]